MALSRGFPRVGTPTTLPCGVRTFLEGPVVSPTSPRLLGRQPINSRASDGRASTPAGHATPSRIRPPSSTCGRGRRPRCSRGLRRDGRQSAAGRDPSGARGARRGGEPSARPSAGALARRRRSSGRAAWAPGPRGPVKTVRPSPSRSSVDTRPGSPGSHRWAMRPPRSARSSSLTDRIDPLGSAERAALCSATGRRSASYESSRASPGPAAHDPGELPAEVEAVADRRVQPGRAARRHAVSRVTDQEHAPVPEALGHVDPERHGRDALDVRLEGGIAGRLADPRRSRRSGQARDRPRGRNPTPSRTPSDPGGPTARTRGLAAPVMK